MLYFFIMNAKIKLLLLTTLAGFTAQAAEERLEVRDLPPAVQQTLEPWRAEGPVKKTTRQMVDGRNVYYIEIEKNNAPNRRLRIAAARHRELGAQLIVWPDVEQVRVHEDALEVAVAGQPGFYAALTRLGATWQGGIHEIVPLDDDLASIFGYLVG